MAGFRDLNAGLERFLELGHVGDGQNAGKIRRNGIDGRNQTIAALRVLGTKALIHHQQPKVVLGQIAFDEFGRLVAALANLELKRRQRSLHALGLAVTRAARRIGHIEQSHRGTLFLDEIESMPLGVQVKLLRVVEEREVHPIGASDPRTLDLRILASSKIDLAEAVAARLVATLVDRDFDRSRFIISAEPVDDHGDCFNCRIPPGATSGSTSPPSFWMKVTGTCAARARLTRLSSRLRI